MSQRLHDCPQCGAPVRFQSSVTVFTVCEHCRSMVCIRDAKVETMGEMAELPPDLSPFQIGTRGEWRGDGFEIVGRVRVTWAEGSWNEWCIMRGDGAIGWLADAQGLLTVSFASGTHGWDANRDDLKPGRAVSIGGVRWMVMDVKEAECLAGEGELPFVAMPSGKRLGVDLAAPGGRFGSIEFDEEGVRFFEGYYAPFDALRLQNLRPVPGWDGDIAQEKNRTDALPCPNCGAPVNLRAAGLSMSAVCGSCSSVIDTANRTFQLIERAEKAVRSLNPLIPIGTRGKLRGADWEVIGMCARADQWAGWSEYLLFNPWAGFRWLVTFRGHWSLVDRLTSMSNVAGKSCSFDGREYRIFASAMATVTGALGEFYWKVKRGEKAALSDFIAPPFILSKEAYPGFQEVTWSHGEYIEPAEVAAAFGMKVPTKPEGIYLNQPNPYQTKWSGLKWPWLLSVIAVIAIQVVFAAISSTREVAQFGIAFDRDAQMAALAAVEKPPGEAQGAVQVSPRFRLDGGTSRIEIEGNARVDNNWIGAELDLVNAETNEHFPAEIEIGYYHGYDDGPWSEGGMSSAVTIPAVPPGEYFLTIEPAADAGIRKMPVGFRVIRGGLFWSNFILMLLLVSVYPVIVLMRRHLFERARWSESDYNPYASGDSE